MKILYAAFKYDYADVRRGYSYEHVNFWDSISRMYGANAIYFAVDEMMMQVGKKEMNNKLFMMVKEEKPDIVFCNLFTNEITPQTIKAITTQTNTITVNWFSDDQWRFENFSRYWAPFFDWVVTTDREALPKYGKIGYRNVIKSAWAANPAIYHPVPGEKYGVTFVGRPHGNRREMADFLSREGIPVDCWGQGWPNGRASQEKMVEIFANSKVNLNFAEVSTSAKDIKTIVKTIAKVFMRRGINNTFHFFPPSIILRNVINFNFPVAKPQIKGRNFEIPACGGFLITQAAEDLYNYYEYDKEIVVFNTKKELAEKIKYYLDHDEERGRIAKAGHKRTIRDHTWEKRFSEIFQKILTGGKRK
ncbi:MAG: glycosyltransferase [Patescibacteria group bacterium]